MLCRTFHEDDLHQFVKKRRCVLEVFEKLLLDTVEVTNRQLVKELSDLSNTFIKLVNFADWGLSELSLSLFVREVK